MLSWLATRRQCRTSTWRVEPHTEHCSSRGRLSALTTPMCPHVQTIRSIMGGSRTPSASAGQGWSEDEKPPADTGGEVCLRVHGGAKGTNPRRAAILARRRRRSRRQLRRVGVRQLVRLVPGFDQLMSAKAHFICYLLQRILLLPRVDGHLVHPGNCHRESRCEIRHFPKGRSPSRTTKLSIAYSRNDRRRLSRS